MKAIFFEQHGEIDVLKHADLVDPSPAVGEALIKVKAVAINHLDIWVRRGWKGLNLQMPHITGSDIAGEILAINGNCQLPKGTRVIANPGIIGASDEWTRSGLDSISPSYKIIGEQLRGGLADLVCVPIQNVYKTPETLSDEAAAASLLVGTTCWRMLFKQAQLRPGQTVLVVGSGGGVNSLSIQLSKAIGSTVLALCGDSKKAEKAQELGADYTILYNKQLSWASEVVKITKGRGVDVVVDNVGAKTMSQSLRAVARGGKIVTVGCTSGNEIILDTRLFFTKQISLIGSTMGNSQDFIDSLEFMLKHNITPVIDQVAPLKDGIKMIKYLEDGKQFGKIVLKP